MMHFPDFEDYEEPPNRLLLLLIECTTVCGFQALDQINLKRHRGSYSRLCGWLPYRIATTRRSS